MATCPECDAEIEVDEFDVDKGDLISCPDCGSNLEVTGTSPIELDLADDDDDDDDDDDAKKTTTRMISTTTTTTSTKTTTRRKRTGTSERGRRRPRLEGRRARRAARRPRLGPRRLQRRRRQRLPRCHRRPRSGRPLPLHHRRQPQLSGSSSRSGYRHGARVSSAPRDGRDVRGRQPGLPRQSRQSLLLLQARALLAPDGASPARAGSPPSWTAATPTTAATTAPAGRRPASSACSARSTTSA